MGVRSTLDRDLATIRDDILRLCSLVDEATARAMDALREQDADLAQEAIANDDVLDSLHHKLESNITTTVALQQPMAGDLRWLIADLLIANELERMGDHAESIARTVLLYEREAPIEFPNLLIGLTRQVRVMLQRVMDAYLSQDSAQAKEVARLDDEMDSLYQELFAMLVTQMGTGEISIERGTYLLWAGHNLERIGDRVTNICERIVYAQTGVLGGLNPKPDED